MENRTMATTSSSQERLPGLTTRRRLQADDLFNLTMVGDVAISPDGQSICFVQTRMDREAEEYRAAASPPSGRVADDVVTLTRIRNKADGTGFVDDRRNHLWTVDLEGHETRLTEGDHDNLVPAWSPDCRSIAFVSKRMA